MERKVKLLCNDNLFKREITTVDLKSFDKLCDLALSLPLVDIVDVEETFARVITLDFYFKKNACNELKEDYDTISSSTQGKILLCKRIDVGLSKRSDSLEDKLNEYKSMIKDFNTRNDVTVATVKK